MPQKLDPARKGALRFLNGVFDEKRLMAEMLGEPWVQKLAPEDRARAQRLATETLRWCERADRIFGKHLRKPPPLPIRNILRLGTLELCQGGDAHGVVNEMVKLAAAERRHANLKGLVNAVLRKVAEKGPRAWEHLRDPQLPKWLRKPLVAAWGAETVGAMEASHAKGAPLDLTPKDDMGDWPKELDGEVLPTGSLRLREVGQVSTLPGFADGHWWVQDAAAALPARLLGNVRGLRVLDLCAAPGGKTLQLAAGGAQVTAVDISEHRMQRVRDNLARTGLSADCVVTDALTLEGTWDAVLLDAPCSATGTIRRHPDLPHAKDGSEFGALIALQAQIPNHAWGLLKPGGRMVFCTCSLLPDEGEAQVEEALTRHADMQVDTSARDVPGVEPDWHEPLGGLRLRPDHWADRGGLDGFYMVCLRKSG